MITVFVPTTPLPTAGFMLLVPEAETVPLNMAVQDAVRLVVSGGFIGPGESQKMSKAGKFTRIAIEAGRARPDDLDRAGANEPQASEEASGAKTKTWD
jgi:uncharacterized membrane protein